VEVGFFLDSVGVLAISANLKKRGAVRLYGKEKQVKE
jgi:hypothetical protein